MRKKYAIHTPGEGAFSRVVKPRHAAVMCSLRWCLTDSDYMY